MKKFGDYNLFQNWSNDFMSLNIGDIYNSVYHRRCNAIRKQLERCDLRATVYRHSLFKVDYYVVVLNEEDSGLYVKDIEHIAAALDIPEKFVDFVSECKYFVLEKELNAKYLDDAGEMRFTDMYDFFTLWKENTPSEFVAKLKDILGCIDCGYIINLELLCIQYSDDMDIDKIFKDMNLVLDSDISFIVPIVGSRKNMLIIDMEQVLYGD